MSIWPHPHWLPWLLAGLLYAGVAAAEMEPCTAPCVKAAIAAQYLHSPFLHRYPIDIEVEAETVILSGRVSEAAERALAEEIAMGMEGVQGVVNRIQVDPALAQRGTADATADCRTDDAALVERVEAQLHWHRATHGMAVDVSAEDGHVILTGQVTDAHQAQLARLITLNTCGVQQVSGRMRIAPAP